MLKYKIADIVCRLQQDYEDTKYWYAPYIYNGDDEALFTVTTDAERIAYLVREGVDITPAIAENMILSDRFNARLLDFKGTRIHSSAMLFDGKVYLFSGPSGVGKSTHTKKWLKRFGDRAVIINDDKPSVRIIDGKCIVYGTPFAGGTDVQLNTSAELGAIVFVERGEVNLLRKLSNAEAIGKLIEQTQTGRLKESVNKALDICTEILINYPVYLLKCNMDDSAVDTALGIINN